MAVKSRVISEKTNFSEKKVAVYETEVPNMQARLAISFVERWAMVAAEDSGEDTAGRQKVRRSTPNEIVDHACMVAEKLCAEFHRRGWLIQIPDYNEINKELDARLALEKV